MIIQCKLCGGNIDFIPGAACGICENCGSASTIPKTEDEGRLELFNRADHFRRQGEFDKAAAAYEKMLSEDDTDAEAHWGAVISRYGIIYAEDPATGKRVPACHRLRLESILSDEDYKAAVEYAPDNKSRRIYQKEGTRIAVIQKDLLAIARNKKPYDVFICYKETDENGRRTPDSLSARDVCNGLTERGFRVFFGQSTRKDKSAWEDEPCIFAALNSARVMVVVGSKPEYFDDVWVRNEWKRYLKLMAGDRGRLLIPCYRGMDPRRLPEELSGLQSLDMWKAGFMEDLIRCVGKAPDADRTADAPEAAREAPAEAAQEAVDEAAADIAPDIDGVTEQVRMFMERGDFSGASEYLDRALEIDPEYAPAYAAKVCVTFGLRKEADLSETTFEYEDNPDWQKALRFADSRQKTVYTGYTAKVRERVARQIRDFAYDCAMEMAVSPDADRGKLDAELAAYKISCTCSTGKRADGSRRADSQMKEDAFNLAVKSDEPGDVSEEGLKTAAAMFAAIGDSEAAERAGQCKALAEQARQKAVYLNAEEIRTREWRHPAGLEEASRLFLSIPDYRDAEKQARACADEAESIRSELYDSAVSAMNAAGEKSGNWNKVKKKLTANELDGYRDVEWLRVNAARHYEACVSAPTEKQTRTDDP